MTILVTGVAGFIGYHLCDALLLVGHTVVGVDNINDYYDINLKYDRLGELGIDKDKAEVFDHIVESSLHGPKLSFVRMHLENRQGLSKLFDNNNFNVVCNLAAQAGVRYSLENPKAYIDSNIVGFANLLECCRNHKIQHLVYASSSSVYGSNSKIPFSTDDRVDHPISLYAATKKSNELMAHVYSHLYGLPTTGLRFFTVYGPWGRPDMALFLFTDAIVKGKPIEVFNHGKMERDFTYIDDIVEGLLKVIEEDIQKRSDTESLYKIYNIGNNKSVRLTDFIETLEKSLSIKADRKLMPIQPGDVEKTWADIDKFINDYNYAPNTPIEKGVALFVAWYKSYYKIDR
jgi:UDP-glucuronate 4-epimerase